MSSHLHRIAERHITYKKAAQFNARAVLDYADIIENEAHDEIFEDIYAPKYSTAQEVRALGNRLLRCANNQRVNIVDGRVSTYCDARCRTKVCVPCLVLGAEIDSGLVYCAIEHLYENHPGCEPLALTLTLKNYPLFDGGLEAMLHDLRAAYNKFRGYALIQAHSIGLFASFEIAIRYNKMTGDLESGAHIHIIIMRGADQNYLPHAKYQSEWQKALGVDYKPQVRISKIIKSTTRYKVNAVRRAVKEACKYTTKTQSYCKITFDQNTRDIDVAVDPHVVITIARALFNRRYLRTFDRAFLIAKRKAAATIKARKEQRNSGGLHL